MSASVLIYGQDKTLLRTRKLVLEREAYLVRTTADLAEVSRILTEQEIDVFILCHSVSPEECEAALKTAHTVRPDVECLVMTAPDSRCAADKSAAIMGALEGPKALLATVQRMAAHHRQIGLGNSAS